MGRLMYSVDIRTSKHGVWNSFIWYNERVFATFLMERGRERALWPWLWKRWDFFCQAPNTVWTSPSCQQFLHQTRTQCIHEVLYRTRSPTRIQYRDGLAVHGPFQLGLAAFCRPQWRRAKKKSWLYILLHTQLPWRWLAIWRPQLAV